MARADESCSEIATVVRVASLQWDTIGRIENRVMIRRLVVGGRCAGVWRQEFLLPEINLACAPQMSNRFSFFSERFENKPKVVIRVAEQSIPLDCFLIVPNCLMRTL